MREETTRFQGHKLRAMGPGGLSPWQQFVATATTLG